MKKEIQSCKSIFKNEDIEDMKKAFNIIMIKLINKLESNKKDLIK